MKLLKTKIVRFVLVGGLNTLISYIIYLFGLIFLPYVWAYTLCYVAGLFISYKLYSSLVFRQELGGRKLIGYAIVYVLQYLIALGLLRIVVEIFLIDRLIAVPIITILCIPINFLLSRLAIEMIDARPLPSLGPDVYTDSER